MDSRKAKGADMRKLKCAVGYNGRVVFLEKFPNDEEHAGLDEMLDSLAEDEFTVEEKAGIYLAELSLSRGECVWTGEKDAELEIEKLEPL